MGHGLHRHAPADRRRSNPGDLGLLDELADADVRVGEFERAEEELELPVGELLLTTVVEAVPGMGIALVGDRVLEELHPPFRGRPSLRRSTG